MTAALPLQPGGLQRKIHGAAFAVLRYAVHPPAIAAGLGEPQPAPLGHHQLDAQLLRLQVKRRPAYREPLRSAGGAVGLGGAQADPGQVGGLVEPAAIGLLAGQALLIFER